MPQKTNKMFYELKLKEHIRVPPNLFKENVKDSVIKSLNEKFEGYVSEELGFVIGIKQIDTIGEGIIIPGDGAAHYETTFTVFTFIPELQEIVLGKISEITDFGAFLEMGPIDGMIHVSQTMDDYVSFSKENVLTGKESKRVLKANDICRARIIAVSYKEANNPKVGLTMRQPGLGSLKWIEEDLKNQKEKQNGK